MRQVARLPVFACAVLLAVAATAPAPVAQAKQHTPVRITVEASPIDAFARRAPEQIRFGALEFRGGLVLTSEYEHFGGFSGLRVDANGERFLAVTDRGYWLRGRIVTDGNRPTAITDAEMAPILGPKGRPLARTSWFDTEALARDGNTLYVGIERVNRILRFDYGRHGLAARGEPIPVPQGISDLPHNKGIEGLVFVPRGLPLAGTLIVFSERGLDKAGNIQGFLLGGQTPGTFSIVRRDGFDITDAALTPAGDVVILERYFSFLGGLGMRIRSIPLAQFAPGAVLDGTVLLEAGMTHEIDNMEGLAAHRNAAGETILTILSDDNFSRLQRTLLLQFALIED